jgi:hypothetical protein
MTDEPDMRTLRLLDLAPHDYIVVNCQCGRIVEYMPGFLQRRHRLPSTTLVYDLQFRLRCSHCRSDRGFEIAVEDSRDRNDPSKPRIKRVIVPKGSR